MVGGSRSSANHDMVFSARTPRTWWTPGNQASAHLIAVSLHLSLWGKQTVSNAGISQGLAVQRGQSVRTFFSIPKAVLILHADKFVPPFNSTMACICANSCAHMEDAQHTQPCRTLLSCGVPSCPRRTACRRANVTGVLEYHATLIRTREMTSR